MAAYQLTNGDMILRTADNVFIPPDPRNRDYEAYQAWLAAGNVADPVPPPSAEGAVTDSAKALLLNQAKAAIAQGDTTTALHLLLKHLEG